jgi:hypothetical protein
MPIISILNKGRDLAKFNDLIFSLILAGKYFSLSSDIFEKSYRDEPSFSYYV